MPSYNRVIVFIFFVLFLAGCNSIKQPLQNNLIKKDFKYKTFAHEDRYIMFALEFERQTHRREARELFLKLYNETLKEEYLFHYVRVSFYLKKYDDVISKVEYHEKNISKEIDRIKKIYILSLMQKKELDKALKAAEELLEMDKSDLNYNILGNIYFQIKEYKKAKDIFKKLYENSLDANSLLHLTNIMYVYLDEKKKAINYLESHIKIYGCEDIACSKLLSYYQEEKNIDGIISVLKKSYTSFKENHRDEALNKIYKLLMYYLEKKDIKEAILFLEESQADNEKLLDLYKANRQYKKAYNLVQKLYNESSNIDYLAQIAIIEFEMAKNKKSVIKSVIKKFEDVLAVLDNHVYQNYLGYILIDFDIDVKRGIEYVNKALEKAPHNLAYIDSLAWGQYKLDDCKNAYINMKKVVDSAGLNDTEIKTHWDKIKECNK